MKIHSKNTSPQEITQQLADNNIKYAISIGRRQPMHQAHADCIKEIAAAGLHPVIIIGSVNKPESRFYNPLKNPLTLEQNQQQISKAMADLKIENYTIFPLQDFTLAQSWVELLSLKLHKNGIAPEQTIMHYRKKSVDQQQKPSEIKPLSEYDQLFKSQQISVWESYNKHVKLDDINSTLFRKMEIDGKEFADQKHLLCCPNYIAEQAHKARQENPDIAMLNKIGTSMLDLTLARLRDDKSISSIEVLQNHSPDSLDTLHVAISTYIKKAQFF